MATIRKRSAGWEVQVRRHGYPVVNQTLSTKADAVAWAAVVESEMARGAFIDRSLAERTTFRDLLVRYEREITVHKKGAAVEACRIQSLLRDPIVGASDGPHRATHRALARRAPPPRLRVHGQSWTSTCSRTSSTSRVRNGPCPWTIRSAWSAGPSPTVAAPAG